MRCKTDISKLSVNKGHTIFHIFTNMGHEITGSSDGCILLRAGSYFMITHTYVEEDGATLNVFMR